ncbi:MAG: hypothetical protein R3Y45_07820 [Bacillota bacterium]
MAENKSYQEFPNETELNTQASEFTALEENMLLYSENNGDICEYSDTGEVGSETGQTSSATSKSTSNSSKITTGIAAVAGVAVIAISVVSGSAEFTKFDVYGTSVDYQLETTIEYVIDETTIMDYDNFDTNLRIITYSDQTDQTDLIYLTTASDELSSVVEMISKSSEGGEVTVTFDGAITGLFEGTSYTTQVVGEDENGDLKVYLTKKFTTTGLQTSFDEIEWECRCRIDGCFYFTMKYVDESGYYNNFYYRLISETTGDVFAEGEIENPTQTQCVNVENADDMDYILEISFVSISPIDIANDDTNKIFNINVKI